MQDAKIKAIEEYLAPLPDSAMEQVMSFVRYLTFMQDMESDYPHPDERIALEEYRKAPGELSLWDDVKANI